MKGIEESLQMIIFIIGSIALVGMLITLTLTLTKTDSSTELKIEGDEQDIAQELRHYIYKCSDKYRGHTESFICFKIYANFTGTITENDIINIIDTSKINKENIKIENITGPAYLIVKYENNKITIENRNN
jgi:hypothetical protein